MKDPASIRPIQCGGKRSASPLDERATWPSVPLIPILLIAALLAGGCGDESGDKITDQGECEEKLKDHLIDQFEAEEFPPVVQGADEQDVLTAIDETLPEFCNEIELREGVELDRIDSRAKAYMLRQISGIGL